MTKLRTILTGALAGLVMATGAVAQDAYGYDSTVFNFEGFYAGFYGGGNWTAASLAPSAGVMAGVNFAVTDFVLAGVEVQAGGNFATPTTYDALMLAKIGMLLSDDAMVYATVGAGSVASAWGYAAGGGVELALMDGLSARGELLATGAFGAAPTAAKGTVGLMWHMN